MTTYNNEETQEGEDQAEAPPPKLTVCEIRELVQDERKDFEALRQAMRKEIRERLDHAEASDEYDAGVTRLILLERSIAEWVSNLDEQLGTGLLLIVP